MHKIEKEILETVAKYDDGKLFIVDFSVSASKKINLLIDKFEGITIGECAKLSRNIRKNLEEIIDDYELNVSSPGIGQSFKVKEQYLKNIGNDVEVLTFEGEKIKGKLLNYNENIIEIQESKKVKNKNSKKKETITKTIELETKNIKSTKLIVKF